MKVPAFCRENDHLLQDLLIFQRYAELSGSVTMRAFSSQCFHDTKYFERNVRELFLGIARKYDAQLAAEAFGDRRIRTNYTKMNCTRLIHMLTPYLVDDDPELRQMAQQLTAYYRDQSGKGWVDEVEELPVPAETPILRRGPEKVVVLSDTWCEEEAERLVQLAKQQGRAVLLGRPTMGTLDYTNPVTVQYDEFRFTYPISRTAASLEGNGVDERGVQPDVYVPWTAEECTKDLLAEMAQTL